MIVDYTHCIHCDEKLKENEFNEDYLIETIYDEFDIHFRGTYSTTMLSNHFFHIYNHFYTSL